ncbi:MAG: hypothetical protein FIA97_11240 [Methylococcaceae bacterium]|nr:hypothetical protein [Methylococcaceae bacterium]
MTSQQESVDLPTMLHRRWAFHTFAQSPAHPFESVRRRLPAPDGIGDSGLVFFIALAAVTAAGWLTREDPASTRLDWNYQLGVIGGVMLLALLAYPLRKRLRSLRHLGSMKSWLRGHAILGLAGPTVILFHADFQLGAVNSNVALFSMLLVMASGLVGRYLYQKIHYKAHGTEITLQDLKDYLGTSKHDVAQAPFMSAEALVALQRFEQAELPQPAAQGARAWKILTLGFRKRLTQRAIDKLLWQDRVAHCESDGFGRIQAEALWNYERVLSRNYLEAVRVVAEYQIYLRIFALWHVIHIPLMVMLVITAVVHVVAVHLY